MIDIVRLIIAFGVFVAIVTFAMLSLVLRLDVISGVTSFCVFLSGATIVALSAKFFRVIFSPLIGTLSNGLRIVHVLLVVSLAKALFICGVPPSSIFAFSFLVFLAPLFVVLMFALRVGVSPEFCASLMFFGVGGVTLFAAYIGPLENFLSVFRIPGHIVFETLRSMSAIVFACIFCITRSTSCFWLVILNTEEVARSRFFVATCCTTLKRGTIYLRHGTKLLVSLRQTLRPVVAVSVYN